MLSLQSHHIVDVFVTVDDLMPAVSKPKGGRPLALKDSELTTILIWNCVSKVRQKTLKDMYYWTLMYHHGDFPKLPTYGAFQAHCLRLLPRMAELLSQLLATTAPIRLMDATMLPVCTLDRAKYHKVAKGVADMGKNWQGWHYGFKLHASITRQGQFCGFVFTPANVYDAQMMPAILNEYTDVAVGDGTYNASRMRQRIARDYHCVVIAPIHPSQKKKVMAKWQELLLRARSKIEAVFDYLKEHMHLVSSFPRSVNGYFLHYVRILLGYQIMVGGAF